MSTPPRHTDLIVSTHIPKTAGRSFRQTLGEVAPGHIQGDYGGQPEVRPTLRRRVRERFVAPTLKPGTRIVHGHFLAYKYYRHYPEATYIAWLRDPVERLASHYYFWKRSTKVGSTARQKLKEQDLSLEEFAALPEMRDFQTRFLEGVPTSAIAFIGITEQYDRSIALFREMLFPEVEVEPTRRNVNPERASSSSGYDLEPETRQAIRQLNQKDQRLYDDAVRRLDEQCRQYGID